MCIRTRWSANISLTNLFTLPKSYDSVTSLPPPQHRFRKFDALTGESHKARFGLSVASLGNINLDGVTSGVPKGFQGEYTSFLSITLYNAMASAQCLVNSNRQ